MDIRDKIITGSYMIGNDGRKEPTNWKDYAIKLEKHIQETDQQTQVLKEESITVLKAFKDAIETNGHGVGEFKEADWNEKYMINIGVTVKECRELSKLIKKYDGE